MMRPEELERRCAEMKSRTLAARNSAGATVSEAVPAKPSRVKPAPASGKLQIRHLIAETRRDVSEVKAGDDRLLRLAGPDRLDVTVSRKMLPRALRCLDLMLKAFEASGRSIAIVQRDSAWSTVAVACGEPIEIRMREIVRSVERPRPANGSLLAGGERRRASRLIREAEEQIRQVEQRYALARERAEREEQERIAALNRDVDCWHRSAAIRAYLDEFRTCMEKWSGPIDPKSDVGRWLAWAADYADRLDPLKPQCK